MFSGYDAHGAEQANFGGAKDFARIFPKFSEKFLGHFLCE